MRLLFATKDFIVEGRAFEGFPLLLNEDLWPCEPAHQFLWETLIESGGVESSLTWEAYGRRLYDFFAFLEANGLKWDAPIVSMATSVVAKYRDWSLTEAKSDPNTVNQRLGLVVRFYEWSKARGFIGHLPFTRRSVRTGSDGGMLAHTRRAGREVQKASVLVRQHRSVIKFLTKEQVRVCLAASLDASHTLLFNLMVRTGLRACEARTFPLKYVFNPKVVKGLNPGQMIRVELRPADMHLKRGKGRSIDVPWSLMEDMYAYSLHEREKRNQRSADVGVIKSALLLTNTGSEFSKGAVVDAMESIGHKVGFPVRAHMLRHTYGTYTLSALRKSPQFEGEPLLYVRDRMGHSDVKTTTVYLHIINQLDAQIILAHEDEMDAMFKRNPSEKSSSVSA